MNATTPTVCQTCSSTNPGGQAFCGTCGHRSAAETIESLTERVAKLEDQLREAVHGRISAHSLELETAENVMARVRRWTTLILFYAGIPAAITLLALAVIFGIDTFDIRHMAANARASINTVLKQAHDEAATAKKTADDASAKAEQINSEIATTEKSVSKLKTDVDARYRDVQKLSSQLATLQKQLAANMGRASSQEAQFARMDQQVQAIQTAKGIADIQAVYPIYGRHVASTSAGDINPAAKPAGALYLDMNLSLSKVTDIDDAKAGKAIGALRDSNYTVTVGPVYTKAVTPRSSQDVGYQLDANSCMYWVKPPSRPPCILYFKLSLKSAAERVRNLVKVVQEVPEEHVLYVNPAVLDPQQRELLTLSAIDFEVVLGH